MTASLVAANGDLLVGGAFTTIGGTSANCIARRVGGTFMPLGTGVAGSVQPVVNAIVETSTGDILAAGQFTSAGGVAANNIARFSGGSWSSIGNVNFGHINALALLPNGDIIVGGQFTSAGGVTASNVARFDGTNWFAMGGGTAPGVSGEVHDMVLLTSPLRVAVVGTFGACFNGGAPISVGGVAQWDPATGLWSAVTSGITNGLVFSTTVWNGNLVIGGAFTQVTPGITVNNVAMLVGTSWTALGSGIGGASDSVRAFATHPNNDLIAGGAPAFATPFAPGSISRFNGTSWSAVGGATPDGGVWAVSALGDDLVVGGAFQNVGSLSSPYLAFFDGCPAIATRYGTGCDTSVGPLVLTATTQPWVGQTFIATAINVPAGALAIGVWGFTQINVPMNPILPPAGPLCAFLASADVLFTLSPAGGVAVSTFPAIGPIGATAFHQVLVLEGPNPTPFDNAGSNGLTVTVGGLN